MRQLKITKQITNRESISLEKYLYDIGKIDLLAAEEETELAIRIKEGDQIALEKLVKANLRFVVSVAKQYQNQGLTLSDLINEGNLGLIKAAQRFDETKGFKFISYAVWWIRQSIMQGLAEQSRMVRLPLNKIGSINKMNKVLNELQQEFEREPTAEEVANIMEVSTDEVTGLMSTNTKHVSVDAPVGGDSEDMTLMDIIADDEDASPDKMLMRESLKKEVKNILAVLPARDANILNAYFGLENNQGLTLDEIGEKFGLTRERVRQIKERAIRRLRRTSVTTTLRTYLG